MINNVLWTALSISNRYEVSTDGDIRALQWKGSRSSRIMKPAKDKKGYLRTVLIVNGKAQTVKVHRIIATQFIPNPLNKPMVNHKNGIKCDNRVENLEWVTAKENSGHAVRSGLQVSKSGDEFHRTKHKSEMVNKLVQLIKSGVPKRTACRQFGVDRSILRRKEIQL